MQIFPVLFAQNDAEALGAVCGLVFYLAIFILLFAGLWGTFAKAGKPGWAAIIPIYNGIVLLEIIGRPIWWILLFFIPCVNFVVGIIVAIDLSKSFGKSGLFAAGLILLPMIFYPILGFDSSRYLGPSAK